MEFIILLSILVIGFIVFNQNKKILNNQDVIKLELNKILVAIKNKDN